MSLANVIFAISVAASVGFFCGFLLALALMSRHLTRNVALSEQLTELCDAAAAFMRRRHDDGGIFSGVALSDCIKASREMVNK